MDAKYKSLVDDICLHITGWFDLKQKEVHDAAFKRILKHGSDIRDNTKEQLREEVEVDKPSPVGIYHYGSDLEEYLHKALLEADIVCIHESQGGTNGLDFYIPGPNVYIEVKAMYTDRSDKQLSHNANVILIQGKSSVDFMIEVLKSTTKQ
jgi:hypothetical protein